MAIGLGKIDGFHFPKNFNSHLIQIKDISLNSGAVDILGAFLCATIYNIPLGWEIDMTSKSGIYLIYG